MEIFNFPFLFLWKQNVFVCLFKFWLLYFVLNISHLQRYSFFTQIKNHFKPSCMVLLTSSSEKEKNKMIFSSLVLSSPSVVFQSQVVVLIAQINFSYSSVMEHNLDTMNCILLLCLLSIFVEPVFRKMEKHEHFCTIQHCMHCCAIVHSMVFVHSCSKPAVTTQCFQWLTIEGDERVASSKTWLSFWANLLPSFHSFQFTARYVDHWGWPIHVIRNFSTKDSEIQIWFGFHLTSSTQHYGQESHPKMNEVRILC